MKKYFGLLIALVASISSLETIAQDSENPWVVSGGFNLIGLDKDIFDFSLGVPALSLTRHIKSGISVGVQFAASGNVKDGSKSYSYSSFDGIIKYNLDVFKSDKIDSYIFGGYGLTRLSDKNNDGNITLASLETFRTLSIGPGLNYYIKDDLSINLSSSYRHSGEERGNTHLQHVIGLSYHFGAQDTDKDGVSDEKDKCPEIPGLKEFEGCPDTDGDGIPDEDDDCPEQAGSKTTNGCPDTDKDGVADAQDQCPSEAGSAELNGCPDSDGDGISDPNDECAGIAGPSDNNGCPWPDSDGDGVNDNEDGCVDEAGPASNDGCPEKNEEEENEKREVLENFINSEKSTLQFKVNSSTLNNLGKNRLNELKVLLGEYEGAKITIEGHASSDGSTSYNMGLSKRRAKAVKKYLEKNGIDSSKMETEGYGESKPIASNDTKEGRSKNRRVKINSSNKD